MNVGTDRIVKDMILAILQKRDIPIKGYCQTIRNEGCNTPCHLILRAIIRLNDQTEFTDQGRTMRLTGKRGNDE